MVYDVSLVDREINDFPDIQVELASEMSIDSAQVSLFTTDQQYALLDSGLAPPYRTSYQFRL